MLGRLSTAKHSSCRPFHIRREALIKVSTTHPFWMKEPHESLINPHSGQSRKHQRAQSQDVRPASRRIDLHKRRLITAGIFARPAVACNPSILALDTRRRDGGFLPAYRDFTVFRKAISRGFAATHAYSPARRNAVRPHTGKASQKTRQGLVRRKGPGVQERKARMQLLLGMRTARSMARKERDGCPMDERQPQNTSAYSPSRKQDREGTPCCRCLGGGMSSTREILGNESTPHIPRAEVFCEKSPHVYGMTAPRPSQSSLISHRLRSYVSQR